MASVPGMGHACYFYGVFWKEFEWYEWVSGQHNELLWTSDGLASGYRSRTGLVWDWAGNAIQETGIECTKQPAPLPTAIPAPFYINVI